MTWIDDPEFVKDRPFGPQTLPYGVVRHSGGTGVAVRVGQHAMPLRPLAKLLGPRLAELADAISLDPLLATGKEVWDELRERLIDIVTHPAAPSGAELIPLAQTRALLPFTIRDYVDFYSSQHHAKNVGKIFRPDQPPLLPNWTHLPVGYHGRAGTIVVSGTDIKRPHGQRKTTTDPLPTFGPSCRLDIEAEVGFVCGGAVATHVATRSFDEHVFGVALMNDWSARDIQSWEYVPLGPFLGKSFATSISGWITPLSALLAARCSPPPPEHPLLPYLCEVDPWGLNLQLSIKWNGTLVANPPFGQLAWSPAQQLAHMTANGATVRPGDLFASGTVSGPKKAERGSFLELSWNGQEPIQLDDGATRTFLEDGDSVVITASAPGDAGSLIGLAEVEGRVVEAKYP
ncbi:fumarylacetoacetate hydrolase family protein [Mycobacterium avium]|uniref:fumarylacetoacetate hydrolase family protein n=1 Tax=Mycobacterium avium TaxID=1764 RepID=UPI0009BF6231|nr:fumarylacetoacetate hydrolase family protein [Mycobacterium avium]